MNLPDYNFLSAPLWVVTLLHIVTLSLHFIAMNILFGGGVVLLFGRLTDRWNNDVIQKILRLFPNVMAATITLGVAPLLFVQLVFHRQVYSASIVSGWFWLILAVVAIVVYYIIYAASFSVREHKGRMSMYLSLTLIGLLYISFVYSSVFSMAELPNVYKTAYAANQSGMVINPDIESYLVRWLHMLSGAIAVGAFFVGWLGKEDDQVYRVAKGFFLWGMIVAMLVGLVRLFTLGDYILPFMRSAAVWPLLAAIILSLGSLHFYFKKKFILAMLLLVVSLVNMVTVRHLLRLIYLHASFDPSSLPVKPQWSIFVVFLLFFVIAVALVWYMLKLYFKSQPQRT